MQTQALDIALDALHRLFLLHSRRLELPERIVDLAHQRALTVQLALCDHSLLQ